VQIPEHIHGLRVQGELLADAAQHGDLDAPLPYCPDWKLRDVVQHTGEVHRWATDVVANGRTEPTDSDPTYPGDTELVDWFREGHAALVDALADAPDDLDCFAFLPAPTPLAFWARRQAHETAIHRVDAESATRTMTPFAPDFATDGLDELLYCFAVRKRKAPNVDAPLTLRLDPNDVEREWFVTLHPEGTSVTDIGNDAACTVRASASDCYMLMWNRGDIDSPLFDVDGDTAVLAAWRGCHRIRWS
jgi:uncharacterized protein (TIGR03083 family)